MEKNFQGRSGAGTLALSANVRRTLPDQRCRYAMLFNWTVTEEPTLNDPRQAALSSQPEDAADGTEIYYGFNGQLVGQLFAGQSTILLPVSNLNQICVESAAGQDATVRYAYFF